MANELRGVSPSGTLYARIMNPAGLWWNGSTFEDYAALDYTTYAISLTEQGNSNLYVADFPSGITSSGTYEYFVYRQAGGSPAEGDIVLNTGKIDWTGTSSTSGVAGSMTGSEWLAYILRLGFKRTDKDAEVYEATTDAIQEMRRRFMFDEAEVDATTTDTIAVLGDYRIAVESDFGMVVNVIIENGDTGTVLRRIAKDEFDLLYPSIAVETDRGYPRHFSIFAGSIYIGPAPDQTSYLYRIGYSSRGGTITSSTSAVPFTAAYRDVLADNVLARLYKGLDERDKAATYLQDFERGFLYATRKENLNAGRTSFNVRPFGC